mgnify:CR=1 FL=1
MLTKKTDIENWEAYLIRNLKFPFEAVGKGCLVDGLPEAEYVTIESLLGYNKEVGLIVGGDFDGQKISYPMFDLTTETESDKLYEVLDDYYELPLGGVSIAEFKQDSTQGFNQLAGQGRSINLAMSYKTQLDGTAALNYTQCPL